MFQLGEYAFFLLLYLFFFEPLSLRAVPALGVGNLLFY